MSTAVREATEAPAEKCWARQHDACVLCGKTESPHVGSGVCRRCYRAKWAVHKRAMERAKERKAQREEGPNVAVVTNPAEPAQHGNTPPTATAKALEPALRALVGGEPAQPGPGAAPILRRRHVSTMSTYQLKCPNCGDLLINRALKSAVFRALDLPAGTELTCDVCDARWRIGKETLPGEPL